MFCCSNRLPITTWAKAPHGTLADCRLDTKTDRASPRATAARARLGSRPATSGRLDPPLLFSLSLFLSVDRKRGGRSKRLVLSPTRLKSHLMVSFFSLFFLFFPCLEFLSPATPCVSHTHTKSASGAFEAPSQRTAVLFLPLLLHLAFSVLSLAVSPLFSVAEASPLSSFLLSMCLGLRVSPTSAR